MPELLEAEISRAHAQGVVGRRIERIEVHDPTYVRGAVDPALLHGERIGSVDRHGKLLLLHTDGAVLGLHFGMSGRLVVDGRPAIERLSYGGTRDDAAWDRVAVHLRGGRSVAVRDPRRLGWIEVDPDLHRLGPDAWSIGPAALRGALAGSATPLKARLLDQSRVAGLGNLLVDELLWRASLDPRRRAGGLGAADLRRLHRHLRRMLPELLGRGGSHTGDVIAARRPGGRCPRDDAPMRTATVGGRTTWWCPAHQRR